MDILRAITCYLQLILYLVFSLTVHWHIWKSNWSIPLKNKQTHSNCCKTCKTHTFMLTLTDWYLCVWWGVSHGHQGREASRQQENQEDLSLAQTHRDSSGPHWEHVGVSSDKVTEPGIWLAEREREVRRETETEWRGEFWCLSRFVDEHGRIRALWLTWMVSEGMARCWSHTRTFPWPLLTHWYMWHVWVHTQTHAHTNTCKVKQRLMKGRGRTCVVMFI